MRLTHPLALLVACVLVAASLTYVLPAGRYARREDPATRRSVVVAGTYQNVSPSPVGPFQAMVAVPKGMRDSASIIFLVFLVGGGFTVVDQTGALRAGIDWLVKRLENREAWVIPVSCLAFAIGGALENMAEEILAFAPVLLLLTRRLGFDAVTAVGMSVGAAAVGSAFSPINPFQVGIAQKLAELGLLSGWAFRTLFLVLALFGWILGTLRHARANRTTEREAAPSVEQAMRPREVLVLSIVLAAFGVFAYGVLRLGWDFEEMSALFFVMGIACGLLGGLGVQRTAEAFSEGFRSMAFAGLLIGFARAIYVVLEQGQIVDTLVKVFFQPIAGLPTVVAAVGILGVEALLHFPVPSVSGQAALTLPLLVPLSDLLGLSRQVTVLAYQYGAGLCEIITPTNGALMAMLVATGVSYKDWMRFVLPLFGGLLLLSVVALAAGVLGGLH